MAAPTETYVDPSIAGDSGAGTIGDAYGDLQYALDQVTRDATNGDRMNILTGTDEILVAALDLTAYGVPTAAAPLIFQGYTSAAGDGGIGGISGDGSYSIIASITIDNVFFYDMHLHNTGSNVVVQLDDFCSFINCEIDNGGDGTNGGLDCDRWTTVYNCNIHNIDGRGVYVLDGSYVLFSTFANGVNDFSQTIYLGGPASNSLFNIIDVDGATDGIAAWNDGNIVAFNSIYSNAGTGQGIDVGANMQFGIIVNNIIEGFSGIGGIGIQSSASADISVYGFNAFYNNSTNESNSADIRLDLGNDQSLSASAFIDAANDDFTVDTSVKALAYPTANYPSLAVRSYFDIGALQREEPAAGGAGGATGGLFRGITKI